MQPYPNMNYYTQPMMQIPQVQVTKFVNRFEDIMASDVPMDGKWVLFGRNDMSEVCAKSWTPQGTINTLIYKLENSPNNTPNISQTNILPQNEFKAENGAILEQIKALQTSIDNLNDKIDKINKVGGTKKNEPNGNS